MIEAPKTFWYFAGTALLIIAIAVAWRIYGGQPATLDIPGGVSVSLGSAISAAQATVTQIQQQAKDQQDEIAQLEQTVSADQALIKQLVAQIQNTPQAPASLKNSARALEEQQSKFVFPKIQTVDPALIKSAQERLSVAHSLASQLQGR